jgi:hypothetical protein
VNYQNLEVLCDLETNETCKIKLYTSSQPEPRVLDVSSSGSVDFTAQYALTFLANRENEQIYAEAYDRNGNSGVSETYTVNFSGLQDFGCDAVLSNLASVCGGDGVCNQADDVDVNTSGLQLDLELSSDDCEEGSVARTLTAKITVGGTTDTVASFTPGAGTVSQTLRVTIPDGNDVIIRGTIEEASNFGTEATGSLTVDTAAPVVVESVLFENNIQSALIPCAHADLDGKKCFDASSSNETQSQFDYARTIAVVASSESFSCAHLATPTLAVNDGDSTAGGSWTLINSQSQCRSAFANTILVAGDTAPDHTVGTWSITVADIAGNISTSITDWVVDRQAPVLTLSGPSTIDAGEVAAYTVSHAYLDEGQEIELWSLVNDKTGSALAVVDESGTAVDATINVVYFEAPSTDSLYVLASDKVGNSDSTQGNIHTTTVTGSGVTIRCQVSGLSKYSSNFQDVTTMDDASSNTLNQSDDHGAAVGLQAYFVATVTCDNSAAVGSLLVSLDDELLETRTYDYDPGTAMQTFTFDSLALAEGMADLKFEMKVGGVIVPGTTTSYAVNVDTVGADGLSVGWIDGNVDTAFTDCAVGFADYCFLSDAISKDENAYVQDFYVSVTPEENDCPFSAPVITLNGGADINGSEFALSNNLCRATFSDLTLGDNVSPDGETVAVTLSIADQNGNIHTWRAAESDGDGITIGLDVVSPELVLTVNGSTDAHTETGNYPTSVSVDYVVETTGLSIGQAITLYVNDVAQPTQTIVDGVANTFNVEYSNDGTKNIYARASDASGNIASSNTMNTTIEGYDSELCNASLQTLNDRQPVNGLLVSSSDGTEGSIGLQVPVVVLASRSISSVNYSCTGSVIRIYVKDAAGETFYTNSDLEQIDTIGSNGTGTVYVDLPQGAVTIVAEVANSYGAGQRDTATVTVDSVAPALGQIIAMNGASADTVPSCNDSLLADFCFTSAFESDSDSDYQKSLKLSVPAENGACLFAPPSVQIGGGSVLSGGEWSLDGPNCLSDFTDVVLLSSVTKFVDPDANKRNDDDGYNPPDGTVVAATITLTDENSNTSILQKDIAVDVVPPYLSWTADFVFNAGNDNDAEAVDSQITLFSSVFGLDGSEMSLQYFDGTLLYDFRDAHTGEVTKCSGLAGTQSTCALSFSIPNGSYFIRGVAKDKAGNDLVSFYDINGIPITVDNIRPEIAPNGISITADANSDSKINLSENADVSGNASSNVIVSFRSSASVEGNQEATLYVTSIPDVGEPTMTPYSAVATSINSNVKVTFNNVDLVNGSHTLSVEIYDAAGNPVIGWESSDTSTSNETALVVDTIAPGCVITGSPKSSFSEPSGRHGS